MRQIDEIHDAEDERQPGGQQEQQHSELKPVQQLRGDETRIHGRGRLLRYILHSAA